jgi:HK97 family phage prohead protease
LASFKKNPVILFAHDSTSFPVGRASSIGVVNDKLMVGVKFASTGLGKAVAGLVHKGFLNALSVGFAPIDYEFAKAASRKGGIDFTSTELLEVSIVPVPANANALLTGMSDGKTMTSVRAKAKRLRDLELIKLRTAPMTKREAREVELARMRAKR